MRLSIRIHNRAVTLKFAVSSIVSGSQNTVANLKHAALESSFEKPLAFRTRIPKLFFLFFFLSHHHSQSQALPNIRLDPALKLRPPLPPHPRGIHIRRALIVRLRDHAHDTDQNLLHTLNRTPALGSLLVVVRVVTGRVQNRYTNNTIGVDYSQPATLAQLILFFATIPPIHHSCLEFLPFGCQMSHWNFMVGGIRG